MTLAWRGRIAEVLEEFVGHQQRIGLPPDEARDDDPREQLRQIIGYLENNRDRMKDDVYGCKGLPTTGAWMELAVKEMNFQGMGTERFWNIPCRAEAILQMCSAFPCDDDRLVRLLSYRPCRSTIRRIPSHATAAQHNAVTDMHPVSDP
ncbi:MAG: hypothetical protein AAF989_16685 [Planctomycetota bacterium]